jgi:hypothetical protein
MLPVGSEVSKAATDYTTAPDCVIAMQATMAEARNYGIDAGRPRAGENERGTCVKERVHTPTMTNGWMSFWCPHK